MVDGERPAPGGAHAEHDDLVVFELDAGRRRGAAGPHRRVAPDRAIVHGLDRHLPERDGDAERRGATRQAHRLQRVARRNACASRFRGGNALRRQQRAFDLHEMHVGRIADPRIAHRRTDAVRDQRDLADPPEVLVRQCRRVRAADGERGRARVAVRLVAAEHEEMRCKRAFRAARHDVGDAIRRRLADRPRQHVAQRADGEGAREIVDVAVALRLAEDGDDAVRRQRTVAQRRLDRRNVVRRPRGEPAHEGPPPLHGRRPPEPAVSNGPVGFGARTGSPATPPSAFAAASACCTCPIQPAGAEDSVTAGGIVSGRRRAVSHRESRCRAITPAPRSGPPTSRPRRRRRPAS